MLELAGMLTKLDIANSPYVARVRAKFSPEMMLACKRTFGSAFFLFSSIHCINDMLHERYEDAVNSYNDLFFPQLADSGKC
jgi:hypothetical protein